MNPHSFGRRLTCAALALTLAAAPGCYVYQPAEVGAVPPGSEVRVYLTRAAIGTLPEEVPVNGLFIRGRLMEPAGDSLAIGIPLSASQPAGPQPDLRQVVRVGSSQVVDVQQRRFSAPRTVALVAGWTGAAALLMSLIFDAQNSTDRPDPDPDRSRVPAFAVPLRVQLPQH